MRQGYAAWVRKRILATSRKCSTKILLDSFRGFLEYTKIEQAKKRLYWQGSQGSCRSKRNRKTKGAFHLSELTGQTIPVAMGISLLIKIVQPDQSNLNLYARVVIKNSWKKPISLERLRFTFTPNGRHEFVPRDQVFPLFSVYSLFLLHKNKKFYASFNPKNRSELFKPAYFLFW